MGVMVWDDWITSKQCVGINRFPTPTHSMFNNGVKKDRCWVGVWLLFFNRVNLSIAPSNAVWLRRVYYANIALPRFLQGSLFENLTLWYPTIQLCVIYFKPLFTAVKVIKNCWGRSPLPPFGVWQTTERRVAIINTETLCVVRNSKKKRLKRLTNSMNIYWAGI